MDEFLVKIFKIGCQILECNNTDERQALRKQARFLYSEHFADLREIFAPAIPVDGKADLLEATGGINLPNSNKRITSIEKGWGQESIYYRIGSQIIPIDEIKEEKKCVGPGENTVYRGYRNGKLVFEMGASIDVTVTFG